MYKKIGLFLFSLAIVFLSWEIASHLFPHLSFILPAPSKILLNLWHMRTRFCLHTLVTLKEMGGGFFLALIFAFPCAWFMLSFESSRILLQPLLIVIQCLPMFTLAPIMVVWFGWSYTAIIIPTALMIFFPLTVNIYQGLRSTPKEFLEFFQTNQATALQTFFKLRLPWALPHIFGGFRISSAIAGIGAVAGEWAGAQNGLGILMLESRRNVDLEITFGALFCLAAISVSLYGTILICEKICLEKRRWRLIFTKHLFLFWKRQRKRFVFPFAALLFFLIFFSSCQKSHTQKTRLLLDWLPNPNHIPLYVGIEKGFFQEEDIFLSIQKLHEGSGGISYLTSKNADLLVTHLPGTLKACSKGAEVKIVGVLIKQPLRGLIYRAELPVKKIEDLSGRSLGYCIGGPDTAFLDFLLKKGHIQPKEQKNVSVDLISAIGLHRVDFIYGGYWNIEPYQLKAMGVDTKWFTIEELSVPKYYEMIILAHSDSKESTPFFVFKFQTALQRSIDFCINHPEEAFACYLKANPDKQAKTIAWEKEAWKKTLPLFTKDQNLDLVEIQNFYNWQLQEHFLTKPFDLQEIMP